MPVMDGYEATRLHRKREHANPSRRRTPIIALTAHAGAEASDICRTAGMDDFLSKPIQRQALADSLKLWLVKAQPGKTLFQLSKKTLASSGDCWDESAALKFLEDDEELLAELMQLFIENAPQQLDNLNSTLANKDFAALAQTAHTLKGMTGNFFAEPATRLAAELEFSANDARLTDLSAKTAELLDAVEQLISTLKFRMKRYLL